MFFNVICLLADLVTSSQVLEENPFTKKIQLYVTVRIEKSIGV